MTRANYLHLHHALEHVLEMGVRGDLLEVGVWYGTTFMPIAEQAKRHMRIAHAVDSFRGMDDPSPEDGGEYPAGALSVGGSAHFMHLVRPYGPTVQVHEGWVPEALCEMDGRCFAFAHIDLDHYAPTLRCLQWLAPRLSPGAAFAVHDYFPAKRRLASRAVNDWFVSGDPERHNIRSNHYAKESNHIWFQKGL